MKIKKVLQKWFDPTWSHLNAIVKIEFMRNFYLTWIDSWWICFNYHLLMKDLMPNLTWWTTTIYWQGFFTVKQFHEIFLFHFKSMQCPDRLDEFQGNNCCKVFLWAVQNWVLKFIYSEKATKFCEISTIDLSYVCSNGQRNLNLSYKLCLIVIS